MDLLWSYTQSEIPTSQNVAIHRNQRTEIAAPKRMPACDAGDLGVSMDTVLRAQHLPTGLLAREEEEVIFTNGRKQPKPPLQQP